MRHVTIKNGQVVLKSRRPYCGPSKYIVGSGGRKASVWAASVSEAMLTFVRDPATQVLGQVISARKVFPVRDETYYFWTETLLRDNGLWAVEGQEEKR